VNISFLILLLSISLNTQATERLQGISGSMGKPTNPFSKLFDDGLENEDIDTTDKRQHEEITLETKLEAERDVAQIKEGERHSGIKDDSASFSPDQEKKSADALPEIDIISDINAQFEHTINKLQATEEVKPNIETAHKRPTQVFINDSITILTKNETSQAKNNSDHANNQTGTIQAPSDNCVKEKVYSLDVDNAAQYKRLEDFPFTYECVIRR
jgi:hypothetical protein